MSRELIVKKVKVKNKEFEYKYLKTKSAVVILPLLDKDKVILVKQYRLPVEETIWELPAGGLEPGEEPIMTAKRELREETGYIADRLEPLTSCFTSPGITNETLHFYIAWVSKKEEQDLDDIEEIDIEVFPLQEVLSMIKEGRIVDAKTILSIL